MTDTDVLIVGAGPTGLTLACLLAERGVEVRIIDAVATPQAGSRGKGLQPRSLELLGSLDVAGRIIANGRFNMPLRLYDEAGAPRAESLHELRPPRPDAPYLWSLLTPQYRIEEALRDRLEQLGRHVEFGTELTDITQGEGGVEAHLSRSGVASTAQAKWLVGCDGGRSFVRRTAGIAFLGETLETHRMLVADVRVEGLDRDHWHMWRHAEGFLALCPLPSTEVFQFQGSVAPGQDDRTVLETLQIMVEKRSGRDDIRLSDPTWVSLWRANIRLVDRYRAGRVFLAGDAAHVHSPAGGQGMNTGIQDAFNLGWKLAAVLGGADAALLDTYQEERLPIAAGVLKLSNALMASTVSSGTIAVGRNEQTLQLGLNYRDSSLTQEFRGPGDGVRAGDRAPEAPGLVGPRGACSLFDLLRGPHATLLGFGARWRVVIEAATERFGARTRGYVVAGEGGDLVDGSGHAKAAYGEGVLFVIRPDHYVGLATDTIDAQRVIAYLERLFGRRAG